MIKTTPISLITFIAVATVVTLFEIALTAGAPWGRYAFGGQNPGKLPDYLRVASMVQALIWACWIALALVRCGVILPRLFQLSKRLMWLVVALNALALVLNTITPSEVERLLWAPIAALGLVSSFFVAIHKNRVDSTH